MGKICPLLPLKFGTWSKKLERWRVLLEENPARQVLIGVGFGGDQVRNQKNK